MDWIEQVQNKDRWRDVLNAVMNLWISQNVENFLTN